MLKTLKLTNFRKHQDLEVVFTQGLNTLKGRNEQGKTTIIEAILYAWFGAKSLREPLTSVVTYDQPESSLKVNLVWEIDGVEYNITRGKSGAELHYGGDGVVTGQTETRAFIERLLGCSANTAKLLMFADQNSVRGVLEEGDAGNLVEQLASLQMIDNIINKVGETLPSGNTKVLEGQLAVLEEAVGKEPEKPLWAEEAVEADRLEVEKAKLAVERFDTTEAQERRQAAQEILKQSVVANAQREAALKRIEVLKEVGAPEDAGVTEADIEAARAEVAEAAKLEQKKKSLNKKWPSRHHVWEGDEASLEVAISDLNKKVTGDAEQLQELKLEQRQVATQKITGTTCGYCAKDLKDIPEVVTANAKLEQRDAELKVEIAKLEGEVKVAQSELQILLGIAEETKTTRLLEDEWWKLQDSGELPPEPMWVGGAIFEKEVPNVAAMERKLRQYRDALVTFENAQKELQSIEVPELVDTTAAEETLAEVAKVFEAQDELRNTLARAENHYFNSTQVLKKAQNDYERDVESYRKAKQGVAELKETLRKMAFNNELVKDLRRAKPQVRDKVWNLILGSVSHYFTAIRGTESSVQREDAEFTVNGRPVKGLSGSTLDSLGLAIRVSLGKTFLPNVPFLVLDEPFAGCDEVRELAGLGTISSAGFDQVLLITHSDLADALSENLLEI